MAMSGTSDINVIRVRRRLDIPIISTEELDNTLLLANGKVTCTVHPDKNDGVSFLRFATCVFSRAMELNRPCLDIVVSRELGDPENTYPQQVLASSSDAKETQESKEGWLSVAAGGYKFGDGSPDFYDKYDVVAVGGTFDRLHVGHRLLLTAASWAAGQKLLIGVTGEPLLRNKQHKDLIASFEERSRAAVSYARRVKPSLRNVDVVELHTPEGPTSSDPAIDALVVSSETAQGAVKVNELRAAAGLKPMKIIVVAILDTAEQKLSSSALRKAEYDNNCLSRLGAM